jgi:hypothetical protein
MDERSNTGEVSNAQVILAILETEPGVPALAALVEINPLRLSAGARIDYLSACERQVAWVQGLLNRALIAVAGVEVQESNRAIPELMIHREMKSLRRSGYPLPLPNDRSTLQEHSTSIYLQYVKPLNTAKLHRRTPE